MMPAANNRNNFSETERETSNAGKFFQKSLAGASLSLRHQPQELLPAANAVPLTLTAMAAALHRRAAYLLQIPQVEELQDRTARCR
jgi:hypothetical protein